MKKGTQKIEIERGMGESLQAGRKSPEPCVGEAIPRQTKPSLRLAGREALPEASMK
jgi:hypothetical protein